VSRRAEIAMSAAEVAAFLTEQHVLVLASNGRDGWPHLMPLWYVVRDGVPWATTYGASQKVRNLERDPRCTLQAEAGDAYDELRGVMLKARVEIECSAAVVEQVEREVFARYHGREPDEAEAASLVRQASKRVALAFVVAETASWDHRKLAFTR
jgi:nitroimidazol reductase NimA-like FMN-containing flavoprotein (pyridoxamine 5'-phosphate oxidase superfamily)